MTKFPRLGSLLLSVIACTGIAAAAQSTDAASWAGRGVQAFSQGDFQLAAKSYEHAVKIEAENPIYLEELGSAYEREAEQSAFPVFLTRKARISFQRALRIDPNNVAALEGLADLEQQPIGLCGGNLTEAALLNNHLADIDPDAAAREQWLHSDAVKDENRSGQRVLCAPVKVVRFVTDPILNPRHSLLIANDLSSAPAPDAVVSQNANADTLAQGR